MKTLLTGILFCLSIFATTTFAAENGDKTTERLFEKSPVQITIGLIPGGNPTNLRVQALELAKKLQAELSIPVNIYISKDYSGLVDAMKNRKVDFAFFSSMTYILAEREAKAKVLLKKVWEQPFYYSAVVVRADSKIKSIEQLRGRTMAFVDQHSSSGYLYPLAMMKKKKWQPESFFKDIHFSGNHQASVKMLEEKKVDAIAVFSDDARAKSGSWTQFASNPNVKFKTLWVSEPIPNDPFCVRQDFYDNFPKTTHNLMFALIELASSDKNKSFSEVLGSKDLIPATSRQYDPVREMVQSLKAELKL